MYSIYWYAMDVNREIVHVAGWSCVRNGCSWNFADHMEKQAEEWLDRLDEASKLTGIDKEFLRQSGIEC